jgi:rubredoxin
MDQQNFEGPLRKIIDAIYKEGDMEWSRLLSDAQKHELYYRGATDVVPELGVGGSITWRELPSDPTNEDDVKRQSINIIRGDGKKFCAVLGQKMPNVKALPDNPRSDADRLAAKAADAAAALLMTQWKAQEVNMRLARGIWTTGSQFGYTRWVADGERFGYTEEPIIEKQTQEIAPAHYQCRNCGGTFTPDQATQGMEQDPETGATYPTGNACPKCGYPVGPEELIAAETVEVPVQVGVKKYPRGRVLLTVSDVTKVKAPFHTESLEECEYFAYEYNESKTKVLAAFPQLRGKLTGGATGGSSASSLAIQVRDIASSPSGIAAKDKDQIVLSRVWISTSKFELLEDGPERDALYQAFPEGVSIVRADSVFAEVKPGRIKDHWSVCLSETSNSIWSDAICKDMIDVQDATTDAFTIALETIRRGMPITIISPDVIDAQSFNKKGATIGEILVAKPTAGKSLDGATTQINAARLPEALGETVEGFTSKGREATGVQPPIFGGGASGSTATEFVRQQNQALAQLGMQWNYMKRFWIDTVTNGVKELAKFARSEEVVATVDTADGDRDSEVIDTAALLEGNFHFESDEAIPLSWGQQREQLLQITGQSPQFAEALEVTSPENLDTVRTLLGMPMLKSAGDDQRAKVHETINELVRGTPIVGEDGVPRPSIPLDEFEDDPVAVFQAVRSWCISESGRRTRKSNPSGYENVKAYGMDAKALADAQAAPPMPPPEGGGEEAPQDEVVNG